VCIATDPGTLCVRLALGRCTLGSLWLLAAQGPKRPGERIYKGHKSYDLMLNLQLGIRYSVGGVQARPSVPMLLPTDFQDTVKSSPWPHLGSCNTFGGVEKLQRYFRPPASAPRCTTHRSSLSRWRVSRVVLDGTCCEARHESRLLLACMHKARSCTPAATPATAAAPTLKASAGI
jgi:hypothetical protein